MRLRTDKLHRSPSKCRTRPLITAEQAGTLASRDRPVPGLPGPGFPSTWQLSAARRANFSKAPVINRSPVPRRQLSHMWAWVCPGQTLRLVWFFWAVERKKPLGDSQRSLGDALSFEWSWLGDVCWVSLQIDFFAYALNRFFLHTNIYNTKLNSM